MLRADDFLAYFSLSSLVQRSQMMIRPRCEKNNIVGQSAYYVVRCTKRCALSAGPREVRCSCIGRLNLAVVFSIRAWFLCRHTTQDRRYLECVPVAAGHSNHTYLYSKGHARRRRKRLSSTHKMTSIQRECISLHSISQRSHKNHTNKPPSKPRRCVDRSCAGG